MKENSNDSSNSQTGALNRIISMKEMGTLGQSFIFAGGAGWGKKALSRSFARLLLCEKGKFSETCECVSCSRIENNQHPDFHYFGEDESKRSFAIAEVRNLLEWMSLRSFEGKAKMAVLIGAERLTTEAANALLKLLEEPPPSSYLVLLTENPRRLLETIRSRCSVIRLRPVQKETIAIQLEKQGIQKEEALYLAKKSNGSFSRALEMHEEGEWDEAKEFIDQMCRGQSGASISLWQKSERAEIVKNIRRTAEILRDALILAIGGSEKEIMFRSSANELKALSTEGAPKLTRKIGYLLETDRALRSNVNQKLALTRLETIWNV